MKHSFWSVILLVAVLSNHSAHSQNLLNLSGAVQVKDLKGKTHKFADLAKDDDGIMIISFWATWCKPCIQELDYLNDIYDELSTDMNVTVYAVSIDDARSAKRVLPFVNGKGWEFEVLLDANSELKRKLSVINVPHTFIIDQQKKIVYQHTSYVPGDEEEYLEVIEQLNR